MKPFFTFEHIQQSIERRYNSNLLRFYRCITPRRVRRLRKKDRISVLFIVSEISSWKTEPLFLAMNNHPRFDAILGMAKSAENPSQIKEVEEYFDEKNYDYIRLDHPWDFGNPDIAIYQKPYDSSYPNWLTCRKHLNSLFCYTAYGFNSMTEKWAYSQPLHDYAWQIYYENESTFKCATRLMNHPTKRAFVTGTPFMDLLMLSPSCFADPWKKQSSLKKRIIFAPHHTISDQHLSGIAFSTFLDNAEFLLSMAQKYSQQVQWAFRPHPLLKGKLATIWGDKKTDEYYHRWATMDNTQLSEGNYLGLFKHSDAMIHDCCSFSIEYLYTDNPVLYLTGNTNHTDSLNEFAKEAFYLHEQAFKQEDIERFIINVVNGNDNNLAKRKEFYQRYLIPPHHKSACENIIEAILGKYDNH